jgi:hypothetical protein
VSLAVNLAIGAAIGAGFYLGWRLYAGAKASPMPTASSSTPPTSPPPASPPPSGLAPALSQLLTQLDAGWPGRSKASDGTFPSAAHHAANPTSDHELGNALDVTRDRARGPRLLDLAEALRTDPRAKYVIYDRRIAKRGGGWERYEVTAIQSDPHTEHLHVSVLADRRFDAAPWDLSSVGTGEVLS